MPCSSGYGPARKPALKAVGIGLSGGAAQCRSGDPAVNGSPQALPSPGRKPTDWSLFFPDLFPNLLCSVVVKGRDWRTVSRPFSL